MLGVLMNWHRSRPPAIFTLLGLVSLHLLALPSPASRCAAGPRREHRPPCRTVPAVPCRAMGRGTLGAGHGGWVAVPQQDPAPRFPPARWSERAILAPAWPPRLHLPPAPRSLGPRGTRWVWPVEGMSSGTLRPRLPTRRCRPPALLPQNVSSVPVSQLLPSSPSPAAPAQHLGVSPVPATNRSPSVHSSRSSLPFPSRQAGGGRCYSSSLLLFPALSLSRCPRPPPVHPTAPASTAPLVPPRPAGPTTGSSAFIFALFLT